MSTPPSWPDLKHGTATVLKHLGKRVRDTPAWLNLIMNKRRRVGPLAAVPPVARGLSGFSRRSRLASSRTRTMTRKRKKWPRPKGKGYTRKFSRKVQNVVRYDLNPPYTYQVRFSGRIATGTGLQSLDMLLTSAGLPVSRVYHAVDLAAIQLAFTAQISAQEDADYEIVNWMQRYQFHNHTNTEVTMEIYRIKPRYNIAAVAGSDEISSIIRGLANQSTGPAGPTVITSYGVTPYMCPEFTTAFKIQRVKKLNLEAGQYFTYNFKGPSRKRIRMSRYFNTTGGGNVICYGEAPLYRSFLVRAYGAPVNSLAAPQAVNTCQVGIVWTCIETITIAVQYQNYKRYQFVTDASSLPALVAPTTMSAASGTAVAVAVA